MAKSEKKTSKVNKKSSKTGEKSKSSKEKNASLIPELYHSNNDLKINNFLENNNVKKIKKFQKNIYISIFVIFFIIYVCNLYYLHNLKSCLCFKILNMDNKVNLNYLLIFNYVFLFVLLLNIFKFSTMSSQLSGGGDKNVLIFIISIIFILISILVYGYYIYNIYQLYIKNYLVDECQCLDNNLRFSLYTHGIILSIGLFIQILSLIVILAALFSL